MTTLSGISPTMQEELGYRVLNDLVDENVPSIVQRFETVDKRIGQADLQTILGRIERIRKEAAA